MKSLSVILLVLVVLVLLISALPCSAQDPIPFNEIARESNPSFSFADVHADYEDQTASSTKMYPHRYWTKRGKIYTFICLPFAVGGSVLTYDTIRSCPPSSSTEPNNGCRFLRDIELPPVAVITATWVALTVHGATLRSTKWLPYPDKKPADN